MEKSTRDKVLNKIPYGLYIVGSRTEDGVAAIIANWMTQVSFNPPLIGIAIESDSDMQVYIDRSNFFSVNFLPEGSVELAKPFLKRSRQAGLKLNNRNFALSKQGTPFLEDAVASFECKVTQSMATGDHTLFVGEITDGLSRREHGILTLKETGWKYSR
ncbi:MAG: flavin reductase [Bacteroidetes bacterium]|nr:flavin reductase [Bacteroidota bacterium]MCW5896319.1 flavin reductase [Bacteroidota bacterium]